MNRPYHDIPRQGRHVGPRDTSEPTTSVRAQQPVQPLRKSKATASMHVLSVDQEKGIYRVDVVPTDRSDSPVSGFQEVARVPAGGDLGGLLGEIPPDSRHMVLENTSAGTRSYAAGRELNRSWTGAGTYDRVTIFTNQNEADEYARAVKEGDAAK